MTLTAISVDRYFIINKPMRARQFTRTKVKMIVLLIWLLSILAIMPMLFVTTYEEIVLPNIIDTDFMRIEKPKTLIICKEDWPNLEFRLGYNIFLALVLFLLPVIFMSFAYKKVRKTLCTAEHRERGISAMIRKFSRSISVRNPSMSSTHKENSLHRSLRNNSEQMAVESLNYQLEISRRQKSLTNIKKNQNEQAIIKLIESRRRIVRLLVVLVTLFFISWLPYHIMSILIDLMHIIQLTDDNKNILRVLNELIFPITLFMAHANSAQNPICFLIMRQDIQKSIKKFFNRK